jgi:hypothetical protein
VIFSQSRFRARLDKDNRRWVLCLLAAAGISEIGITLVKHFPAEGLPGLFSFFIWPFFTLFFVALTLLHSRLVRLIGARLGGTASLRDLHAVSAWAAVPIAACAPLLLALFILRSLPAALGPEAAVPATGKLQFIVRMVLIACGIWTLARSLVFLAEAQQFSKWRALANQSLAAVVWLSVATALIRLGNIPF